MQPWEKDPIADPWDNDPAVTQKVTEEPDTSLPGIPTVGDYVDSAAALGEVAATAITSGVAEITAGFGGAVRSLLSPFTGQTQEEINAGMEDISNRFTYIPRGEQGRAVLDSIGPKLAAIDEVASDVSWGLSMGNEYAATLIKTGLMGAVELVAPSKGTINAVRAKRSLSKAVKDITESADRLGIETNINTMGETIVEAAQKLTPAQRAENIPLLQQAVQQAEEAAKGRKNAAYEAAKQTKTWVDTRSVRDLSIETRTKLMDRGYDLDEMPIAQKRLTDLYGPDGTTRANLSEFEKVRKRINNNRSSSPSENAALNIIKKDMDDFLDNEFNKIAMGNGSALSGDPKGLAAWKEAREANTQWRKNFYHDKQIKQLVEMDATPEQFREWIMGATAMGAKKQAASTVSRLRDVLGDNHPAIEGIRQDFLFEVAEPLLKSEPNFKQFIRNYDAMIRRNPSLMKELGLDESNFAELRNFAEVQSKLPPNRKAFELSDLSRGLAVFWQGHSMAKRSLRVAYARGIFNSLFDADRVSQKQIIYELAGLKYGEVAMPKKGPLAAQFIAGAALNDMMLQQEERMGLKE